MVKTNKGSVVTIGRVDGFDSANVDAGVLEACFMALANGKTDANLATIRSWLDEPHGQDAKLASAYLLAYYKSMRIPFIPTVYDVSLADMSYSIDLNHCDGEHKPSVTPFMSPIDNRAFNPVVSVANSKWAVESRVLGLIAENAKLHAPSAKRLGFMADYVTYVTEHAALSPSTDEEVDAQQRTPSQRRGIAAARDMAVDLWHRVSSFMKREAYVEVKDPRVITQFNATTKRVYTMFILPLAEYIKNTFKWYGFKTPLEIANHMVEVANHADAVIMTDYARFDGRVNEFIRRYHDKPLLLGSFHPQYRDRADEIYRKQSRNLVRMGEFTYNSGDTQNSGGMDTSLFNTSRNASLAYCSYREYGFNHVDTVRLLSQCAFGGDDGVIHVPKGVDRVKFLNVIGNVTKAWGMKIEAAVVERGRPFTFLARWWNPWHGSNVSMCDIPRQMAKFHTSVGVDVNPREKLREKGYAFYLTDRRTPIIGPLAEAIVHAFGFAPPEVVHPELTGWWARYDVKDQFPNELEDWTHEMADDYIHQGFDDDTFRTHLAVVLSKCDLINHRESPEAIQELLSFPLCFEVTVPVVTKQPVVLNGDVTLSNNATPTESQPKQRPVGSLPPRVRAKRPTVVEPIPSPPPPKAARGRGKGPSRGGRGRVKATPPGERNQGERPERVHRPREKADRGRKGPGRGGKVNPPGPRTATTK